SGTNLRSFPLTFGTRRLSKLPNAPPLAARAALQAAVPVSVPPPAHAAVRLIGEVVAPCASAGSAGASGNSPAAAMTTASRRIMAVLSLLGVRAGRLRRVKYADQWSVVQPLGRCDCMAGLEPNGGRH